MIRSWHRKLHSFIKASSFRLAISALLVSLCGIFFVAYFVYHEYPEKISQQDFEQTRAGLNQELQELMIKGDEVAKIPKIVSAIASEDSITLSEFLPIEKDARGINLMKAMNKDGVVLARSVSANATGDNAFVNSPIGREMVRTGKSVAATETSLVDPRQLIISTGRFVYRNNVRVGGLTATYLADDNYAQDFAHQYLAKGSHVAFYTKEYGLFGTSVTEPSSLKLLNLYIKPELELLSEDNAKRLIRMPDGRIFIARNIILPGLESSVGGVLIFTQIRHTTLFLIIGFVVPLLSFFFVLFVVRRRNRRERALDWFCPIFEMFIIFYCITYLAIALLINGNFQRFRMPVYPLYNSVLRIQPEGGVFDSRFAQRLSVVLDSGGEAINAIRLSLAYDPIALNVQSIDMDRSICEHFIVSEHNSQSGKIEMECIIPSPGFSGNSAILADLFFKAEAGTSVTNVRFLDDSQVLANDGLGTNVLRLSVDSAIRFTNPGINSAGVLTAFSPSHPNPERWYAKKTVALSWTPALVGGLFSINGITQKASQKLPPVEKKNMEDGIHSLTISARDSSGVEQQSTLQVKIDTKPPEELTLSASEIKIKPGGLVRFTASGKDSMSGLQRIFYLRINDEIFFPIGQEIHIPFPQSGIYTITLRAYDKAGNYRDVSKKITVRRYQ